MEHSGLIICVLHEACFKYHEIGHFWVKGQGAVAHACIYGRNNR